MKDLLHIAEKYTIKQAPNIIANTLNSIGIWENTATEIGVPSKIMERIKKDFVVFDTK